MNVYFIQEHLERKVFHGGICNVDAEKIFVKKGYVPIKFPYHYSFSSRAKLARVWFLVTLFFTLPSHACIFFQFPMYASMSRLLVKFLQYRKSIRLICFIADIDGMRDGDDALLQREINALKSYPYFIVHNDSMRQWLLSKANPAGIGQIDFFDFLTPVPASERQKSFQIAFAGNLEKSSFLDEVDRLQQCTPQLVFHVYGQSPSAKMLDQANILYHGIVEPYLLPGIIRGSFGLVWDGDSIDGLSGTFGKYMVYNSPHKLSLYILTGMPIIVNTSSAAAALVKKYGIGFAIDSLYDLEKTITAMPEEDYRQMVNKTKEIAALISNGGMLEKAIAELSAEVGWK